MFFIFLVNLKTPGKNIDMKLCTKSTTLLSEVKFIFSDKATKSKYQNHEEIFVAFSEKLKFTIKRFSTFDKVVYLYFLRGSKNGKK